MTTKEEAIENFPEMVQMDGYEDCVIGICHRFGQEPILAYDFDKVITRLKKMECLMRKLWNFGNTTKLVRM